MSIQLMSLVFTTTLKPDLKFVLLALADRADDDGECFPGLKSLSQKCSMSESTVRRKLQELEELGILKIEINKGGKEEWRENRRPNLYIINILGVSKLTFEETRGVKTDDLGVSNNDLGVSNEEFRGVTVDTQYININTSTLNTSKNTDSENLNEYFISSLISNNLITTKVKGSQEWINCFERMMRIDQRTFTQIQSAIDFAHSHDFWAKNILSPIKLREKYDRLRLEATNTKQSTQSKNVAMLRQMLQEESFERIAL